MDRELGDDAVGVIRPILLAPLSVNQRLPSGPAAMPSRRLAPGGRELRDDAAGVIRPILCPP